MKLCAEFEILHVKARGQRWSVIPRFDADDAVGARRIIAIEPELTVKSPRDYKCHNAHVQTKGVISQAVTVVIDQIVVVGISTQCND